jgi:hypothetical protein
MSANRLALMLGRRGKRVQDFFLGLDFGRFWSGTTKIGLSGGNGS